MASPRTSVDIELLTVAAKPRMGGMTNWFDQIAHGLSQRGWKIRLVAFTDRIEGYDHVPFEVVHLPLAPPSKSRIPLIEKWSRWRWVRKNWEHRPLSIPRLRISDGTPGILDFAHRLHRRSGIPWGVLMGGNIFEETQDIPLSKWLHRRIFCALNQAERILVDGPDLVASLRRQGIPDDRFRILYQGIDLDEFRQTPPAERYFPARVGNPFRMVWHGRLAEHHGPERFLHVAERVPEAIGRFAGGGTPSKALESLLSGERFQGWFLGSLPRKGLIELLQEADCGIYPLAKMAGIPTVLLESMAAGLPTVTLRTGACDRLIHSGSNGFIVEDVEEMIVCVNQLRSNPELCQAMGLAARNTIRNAWSTDTALVNLEKILEEWL